MRITAVQYWMAMNNFFLIEGDRSNYMWMSTSTKAAQNPLNLSIDVQSFLDTFGMTCGSAAKRGFKLNHIAA